MTLAEHVSVPGRGWRARAHRGLACTPLLARAERARPPIPQGGWREGWQAWETRSLRRYASRGDIGSPSGAPGPASPGPGR